MASDHTQQQSSEEQRRAQELSINRTAPPTEVPGYETQQFLGSGAYGEVWVGVDKTTGRRVAIKFLTHGGRIDWSLLSREVEKLAVLSADRYVVQLLDVGWEADPPYYVMDYIENGSLEDALRRDGTYGVEEAVELFEEVAVGLMHLHGKGVLHCDLKPANVLLDEDNKPRLADFGQSRLSHEQAPALGTLFYMAPEQADLEAVPDARWDVYALGALLYCMLSGEPPYRSDETVSKIDTAPDLSDRLARYRTAIANSQRPTQQRQLAGVDRSLADIVDRCLASDPEHRFSSVQSVLDALRAREESRARRPLMVLGLFGPIALLLLMGLFGWRGYHSAVQSSQEAVERRARESNEFFALSVARTIEEEIPRYFRTAEEESDEPRLHELMQAVNRSDSLEALQKEPVAQKDVDTFLDDPKRLELREYLHERLDIHLDKLDSDDRALKFASIFVTNPDGTIAAVAFDDKEQESAAIGLNYSWRTYYHGQSVDLPRDQRASPEQRITKTHLSAVFHSTTTRTWKVAVSTPIMIGEEVLGLMILTVELGDFTFFRNADNQTDHFAVLVDLREESKGTILYHPFFKDQQRTDEDYTDEKYRVDLSQLRGEDAEAAHAYRDPLGNAPRGDKFAGEWIAAMETVRLPNGNGSSGSADLAVIVQEGRSAAIDPIQQLADRLTREGGWALAAFILVVFALWYYVVRTLGRSRHANGRHPNGRASSAASLHSRDTVNAPQRGAH